MLSKSVFLSCKYTAQKMKFSIKNFFSKYDQIRSFLRIWSHTEEILNEKLHLFCSGSWDNEADNSGCFDFNTTESLNSLKNYI